ncbi:MAG: hypothetical protein M3R54_09300 [Chloroflexota bacterium]|nr:hypothetical protein [Chloroflexota bacterium]
MVDVPRAPRLHRIESAVEQRLRELAEQGQLRGLPGEGARSRTTPTPTTRPGPLVTSSVRRTWSRRGSACARRFDERRARVERRLKAHREWLQDRTLLLAQLPADRIVDASRATAERDQKIRAELEPAVSELNALIRRFDLLVTLALQLPLVTLDRL